MNANKSDSTRNEIFIGIVAPTGSDKKTVIDIATSELESMAYKVVTIKLSAVLKNMNSPQGDNKNYQNKYEEIEGLMDEGNKRRKKMDRGDALALYAIAEIVKERSKLKDKSSVAYILDSLKHPEEIETLRSVYGESLSVVSVYTPREIRVEKLTKEIDKSECSGAKKRNKKTKNKVKLGARCRAEQLIGRDTNEDKNPFGQRVRDAFPLGDLFVDTRNRQSLTASLKRFLEIVFCYPYHTPMKDEYFMALASHASMRSADLSRQVGAVIATKDGEVIALGCNEVPKFGGGMYWPGSVEFRDYQLGYDSGTTIKNDALYDVLNRFRREFENAAKDKKIVKSSEKIFNELLDLGNDGGIKLTKKMSGTLIRNLLEFGRSVHAEMAALMDAALRGVSVKGGTLYCTTFPCHLCARHIVAAGITRVVYIEPYPKSLAGDLYPDSLQVDPIHPAPELVNFEPFVGISPWKYASFFRSILLRKDDDTGKNISWTAKANTQRFHPKVFAYRLMECAILELLPKKVVKEDSLAACKKVEQCFKPNIEEIIVLKYPQKKPVR